MSGNPGSLSTARSNQQDQKHRANHRHRQGSETPQSIRVISEHPSRLHDGAKEFAAPNETRYLSLFFLARFFVAGVFEVILTFAFLVPFAAFVTDFDLDFFLVEVFFGVDAFAAVPLLALAVLAAFFRPVIDFNAFCAVPFLISKRIFSTAFLTGFLPFADASPTMAPATLPTIAPTGPPTIPPTTAPVMPPAVCFDTDRFSSVVCLDPWGRPFLFDFFLGMIYFQGLRNE
ncbi:MAG: hypothetical protein WD851_23285 [Pirellulales bacterium]